MSEVAARSSVPPAPPNAAGAAHAVALAPQIAALALTLLLGLQPVMTDHYLPALPLLARELAAPMSAVQLTMSALILTFGLSQLVWGPLADRFGRRPVLLGSLSLLALASVAAAASSQIGWLVFWRGAQGAMLAAAVVCARAMVRDLYEPHEGARVMSLGLSGLGVLAVSAPLLGGVLAMAWGWRSPLISVATFAFIVLVFVWRRLPETLAAPDIGALQWRTLARNAGRVLSNPTFRAWALLIAATYGGLFTVLAASAFAYIDVLGLTPTQCGMAIASGSFSYLIGTFFCRRWLPHLGLLGTVRRGAWFTLAGGAGMALCALSPWASAALLIGSHCLFAFGHGIHQPCGQTGAVGPFPRSAGVASALAGCLLALTAFAVGLWLGHALDGTLRPMGLSVAFWALVTTTIAWTLVQRHGAPAPQK